MKFVLIASPVWYISNVKLLLSCQASIKSYFQALRTKIEQRGLPESQIFVQHGKYVLERT